MSTGTLGGGSPPTGGPGTGFSPSTDAVRMDAMSACLARNWWAVALRGVIGVLFGIVAFVSPVATILSLVLVFSAYMLIDGVLGIVAAVRAAQRHERWGLLLFEGILDIAVGVAAFLLPGGAVLAFVLLMAAWALVTGGLMVAAAFRLHAHYGRWLLALTGVVSIIYGILLAIAPMIGAVVLTWWLGAYALVFGVMLLVLAFRLRARQGQSGPGSGLAASRA